MSLWLHNATWWVKLWLVLIHFDLLGAFNMVNQQDTPLHLASFKPGKDPEKVSCLVKWRESTSASCRLSTSVPQDSVLVLPLFCSLSQWGCILSWFNAVVMLMTVNSSIHSCFCMDLLMDDNLLTETKSQQDVMTFLKNSQITPSGHFYCRLSFANLITLTWSCGFLFYNIMRIHRGYSGTLWRVGYCKCLLLKVFSSMPPDLCSLYKFPPLALCCCLHRI